MANCFGSLSSSSGANVVREGVSSWAKLFWHTETHKSQTKGKGPISSFLFKGRQSWYPNDRQGRRSRIGTIALKIFNLYFIYQIISSPRALSQHAVVLVPTSAFKLRLEASRMGSSIEEPAKQLDPHTMLWCKPSQKNVFYLIWGQSESVVCPNQIHFLRGMPYCPNKLRSFCQQLVSSSSFHLELASTL